MDCAFCELAEIQDRKIIENELSWAFLTNIPITPGHTLISPKRCISNIKNLNKEEILSIFDLAQKIKTALIKTFDAEGFNIAWNEGLLAGQSVPHFHLHVVPRKSGDTGIYQYEPRQFLYRPGSRESNPEGELVFIAKELRLKI